MYVETIAERLRKARTDAGYTQNYVCDNLGISQSTLCNYERGFREPSIEVLGSLIDFYEVPANQIIATKR